MTDHPRRPYGEYVVNRTLMTQISFTSGELMDIIAALEVKEDHAYQVKNDPQLAAYYLNMINQFERVIDRLSERPGEHRVANLVLAA